MNAGSLSLSAFKGASVDEIIAHCERVAGEIPVIGFYLQPAVGGMNPDADFWERFAAIENVVAIKVAPLNRYRSLDVIPGVVAARAEERVTLYTGNDDHIVLDLVTSFTVMRQRLKRRGTGPRRIWHVGSVEVADMRRKRLHSVGNCQANLLEAEYSDTLAADAAT